MTRVAVVGGSGYTGGELLRLLLQHPDVELVGATSQSLEGEFLHRAHPNLRGRTALKFTGRSQVPDADVVVTCVPHGSAMDIVPGLMEQGSRVVDLSADFRLRSAKAYESWYGTPHKAPQLLSEAVYGLPEAHRDRLRGAKLASGVGCTATAIHLALRPLVQAGLLATGPVVADVKVGSSAAGAEGSTASMHAERSGSMRLYAATRHRHVAELEQELALASSTGQPPRIHYSAHAAEMVRGILATCHVFLERNDVTDKDLWIAYRTAYGTEPFVRLVSEKRGIHRTPDPKLVAGSNLADIGFEVEAGTGRAVVVCALDNLVKGAAGSAVQSMNLMLGLDETRGLTQIPLHPV